MPRIQIYIPVKVKAEMDAVEQHRPNWSDVAQRAFIIEAARLERLYGSAKKPKGGKRKT